MNKNNKIAMFSILVVIYNKEANECQTLNALKKHPDFLKKCNLCVWNNGPKNIIPPDYLQDIAYHFKFIETIENRSLSKIYNTFLTMFDSDYYIFLDDDSSIEKDYIADILKLTNELFVTPIVRSNKQIISPSNLIKNSKEKGKYLRAIASGLLIHKELINKLKSIYGSPFDEKFYFYGVDTSFVYRINKLNINNSIIRGFEHKISEHEIEDDSREKFKSKELSYSFGLKLRYYPSIEIYKHFLALIIKKILHKNDNRMNIKSVIYAYCLKTHPRNKK
ncbi:glycosyltransferase family 2 protein [Proteus terrae]|uniref:glycosyltransferase family 2 protein n=1 Tax=Proteus terrae TaxID=1574161 RepID=UPI001330B5BF|nr:glycosyltransferase [Proteus terrae]QKD70342.1 glycosyltransferase [Proteus terrae subsp. cibarius]QKD72170.1 glycosyltransferase [Proteus terrae subsp. cibarius]UDF26755.1 glycosyltransferase [Proteus terrae subsp. cibarius]